MEEHLIGDNHFSDSNTRASPTQRRNIYSVACGLCRASFTPRLVLEVQRMLGRSQTPSVPADLFRRGSHRKKHADGAIHRPSYLNNAIDGQVLLVREKMDL